MTNSSVSIKSNESIENILNYCNEETDLRDVTLVCDDSQQIEAHKFILSARSPFFKKILASDRYNQQHAFIFFCDYLKSDIEAVLEFLYLGEVTVSVEGLKNFINFTKLLEIEGIDTKPVIDVKTESPKDNHRSQDVGETGGETENVKTYTNHGTDIQKLEETVSSKNSITLTEINDYTDINIKNSYMEQLEEKSNEMDECFSKIDGLWECKVCEKTFIRKDHIKSHVKLHKPAAKIPCPQCHQILGNKDYLRKHLSYSHSSERFTCESCGKTDMTKSKFKTHKHHLKQGTKYSCILRK